MFEQTFKNIDDILYKDSGADSELDYIGQTSWILFLRYLDELEKDKADEAELEGETYHYILAPEYRWQTWAMPKKPKAGSLSGVEVDLSVKNPNLPEEAPLRSPEEILAEMVVLDGETAGLLESVKGLL